MKFDPKICDELSMNDISEILKKNAKTILKITAAFAFTGLVAGQLMRTVPMYEATVRLSVAPSEENAVVMLADNLHNATISPMENGELFVTFRGENEESLKNSTPDVITSAVEKVNATVSAGKEKHAMEEFRTGITDKLAEIRKSIDAGQMTPAEVTSALIRITTPPAVTVPTSVITADGDLTVTGTSGEDNTLWYLISFAVTGLLVSSAYVGYKAGSKVK